MSKENALSGPDTDNVFTGSIPKLYEEYLVPLIFEPYAVDLVKRVASRSPADVLKVAAGTGVVTRKLASALPESVSIVCHGLESANAPDIAAAAIAQRFGPGLVDGKIQAHIVLIER